MYNLDIKPEADKILKKLAKKNINKIGYYVDTCIWLNLFKKETAFWEMALEFIGKIIISSEEDIIYTGFILRELEFKLDQELLEKVELFLKKRCIYIPADKADYQLARNLELESKFTISFFDCMHIAICKRLDYILITRDKALIEYAKSYILVKKPEEV